MNQPEARSPSSAAAFRWSRLALLLAFVIAFAWVYRRLDVEYYISPEHWSEAFVKIKTWVGDFGSLAPVVFVLAGGLSMVVNFPAALIIHLAVLLFGPWAGSGLALAVILLGTSIIHQLAHHLGRPIILKVLGGRAASPEARIRGSDIKRIVMLRLVLFVNPILSWLFGLAGIPFHRALVGTAFGVLPGIMVLAWLTGEIAQLLEAGESLNPIRTPELLIPLAVSLLFFGACALFSRRALTSTTTSAS